MVLEQEKAQDGGCGELQVEPERDRGGVGRGETEQQEDRTKAAAEEHRHSKPHGILPVDALRSGFPALKDHDGKHRSARPQIEKPGELELREGGEQDLAQRRGNAEKRRRDRAHHHGAESHRENGSIGVRPPTTRRDAGPP